MCFQPKYDQLKSLVVSICLILSMLVSCSFKSKVTGGNVSFESLCGLTLQQFESMNEEEAGQWMRKKHGENISSSTKQVGDSQNWVTIYKWEERPSTEVFYLKDEHPLHLSIFDIVDSPSFGEVVSGLGSPDTVYGNAEVYEQVLYSVDLDYPKLGISVGTSDLVNIPDVVHGNSWAIQLRENMKVDYINCYKPRNSIEEVLRDVFLASPESVQIQLERRTPWLGFASWVSLREMP